jgi:hypothetical protein
MKSILLLLLVVSSTPQCNKDGELPLIKATSQSWSGGAAAMRGTYYNIYLRMTMNPEYIFDSLWVNGKRLPVEILRSNAADTLTIHANEQSGARKPGTNIDPSKSAEATPPIQIKGEGILGYFYKGKRMYTAIPSFDKLKPLAYP